MVRDSFRVGFRVRVRVGLGLGLCHFLNPPVSYFAIVHLPLIQRHHIVPLFESSRREDSDVSYCVIF